MGFWNSVIYITTSRAACRTLFAHLFRRFFGGGSYAHGDDDDETDDGIREVTTRKSSGLVDGGSGWGDSSEELRGPSAGEAV